LCGICKPCVHAIEEPNLGWQQVAVIRALLSSNAILLLVSPGVHQSPWVCFELLVGRLLLRPIIRLNVIELSLLDNETLQVDATGC